MNALDHARTARPPTAWSAELVRGRLVEAFSTERRMPRDRHFAAVSSAWPASPIHSFAEVMHWDDARERVWENWSRAKGVYSFEVTRMEETFDWLRLVNEDDRRWLHLWAKASARGLSLTSMMKSRGWSRTTFYRRVDQAAVRIADALNAKGVQVR